MSDMVDKMGYFSIFETLFWLLGTPLQLSAYSSQVLEGRVLDPELTEFLRKLSAAPETEPTFSIREFTQVRHVFSLTLK